MQLIRKHSSTSNILRVVLRDSGDGSGLTGLAHDTSGLIISTICDNEAAATSYTAAASKIEDITTTGALGTFAAPTATKCRFEEVDSTNHPGLYELQLADARFAVASAKQLDISISGAADLLRRSVTIQLDTVPATDADGDPLSTATAVAAVASSLGTPVALDGGTATVAGMLSKLADDNGGADYDAGRDSLSAQRRPVTSISVNVAQLRERLDTGARVVFEDRSFFNDSGRNMRWGFLRQLKRPNAGIYISSGAGSAPAREAIFANYFTPTNATKYESVTPPTASALADMTTGFVNHYRTEWKWTGTGSAWDNIWIPRIDPDEAGNEGCAGWHDVSWMANADLKVRLLYVRSANGATAYWQGQSANTVLSGQPVTVDTSTGDNAVGQICWVDTSFTVGDPTASFGFTMAVKPGAEPTTGKGLVLIGARVWSPSQSAYGIEYANMAWVSNVADHLDVANMTDANLALYAQALQVDTVFIWFVDGPADPAVYAASHVALAQRWETAINAARAIDPTIRPPVICFVATPENSDTTDNTEAEALKAAASANGYSCVDLFTLMARKHGDLANWSATYTSDGLHPNDAGREVYAGLVCDEIFETAVVPTLDQAVDTLPTAVETTAAVWGAATSGYTSAGTFGKLIGTTWSTLFSGITSLAAWLRALTRSSTADATALSEINTGGGTYAVSTDSLEAGGTTRATIAAKTNLIGVGRSTLVSPVGAEGDITVLLHGRYRSAAGAANSITTDVSSSNLPSTVSNGATATLRVVDMTDDSVPLDDVGVTVSGVGGDTITLTVTDLDLDDHEDLEADESGRYRFSVLNDADAAPLWFGRFLVKPGPAR